MDYAAEAKRMFLDREYQWKQAFAFDLHQKNPRLTAEWAILCAERLLAARFPERLIELQRDLAAAREHLNSFPESSELERIEMEIWERPNRDAAQTAVSKLFTTIREFHQRKNCVVASGMVISNLVSDDWSDFRSPCTSIELFRIVHRAYLDVVDGHRLDEQIDG